MEMNA